MRLSLGNLPAMATHTLIFLVGMTFGRFKKSDRPVAKDLTLTLSRNHSLLSLPSHIQNNKNGLQLTKNQPLSLVMVSNRNPQAPCLLSQATLRHHSSKPHWLVQIHNQDIYQLSVIYKKNNRSIRVLPAHQAATLMPCRTSPEVIYGSF